MRTMTLVAVCGLFLSGCSRRDKKEHRASMKSATTSSSDSRPERIAALPVGVITAIGPGPSFPCAPSREALPELMKWQKATLDENAPDSVINDLADTLMRTKSIMLGTKDMVKVLDKEPGLLKVSVVKHSTSYGFAYMNEAARGCWLVDEAVAH
jgi:hypothetical protein